MPTNRVGNRTAAELKKFWRSVKDDTTQPIQIRMRAASKLQRLYDLDSPPVAPPSKPITRAEALAAIQAVTGKGNA